VQRKDVRHVYKHISFVLPLVDRYSVLALAAFTMRLTSVFSSLLALSPVIGGAAAFSHNDFSCRSTAHPNPVVLLHGLGATYYEDLNFLASFLQSEGYCTFSLTYGAYPGFPFVGGLRAVSESAPEIAAFIKEVHSKTGANKVDLIGHSEGGFQSLYVPKFEDVAPLLDKIVAIAPPTHGTTLNGVYNLAYVLGNSSRELVRTALYTVGCPACDDLGPGGLAVERLNDGQPIAQPGTALTVIQSRSDELVTPPETAFVQEPGVWNVWVQDFCPHDRVGHLGEAYDKNVWYIVRNALESAQDRKFNCTIGGFPARV